MEWFEGDVLSGVQAAKQQQALFVGVVYGDDDASRNMMESFSHDSIASFCGASSKPILGMKFPLGSQAAGQLAQAFKTGTGARAVFVDVAKGKLEHNLEAPCSVESVLKVLVELCGSKAKPVKKDPVQDEKERELARRREGQAIVEAQQKRKELQMQQQIEQRRKEKAQEAARKAKILAEIEQDKNLRQGQKAQSSARPTSEQQPAEPNTLRQRNVTEARLSFRLPNGTTEKAVFKPSTKLDEVMRFVSSNFVSEQFELAEAYPFRVLDASTNQTLEDMGLIPRAQLIVKLSSSSSGPAQSSTRQPNICESIMAAIKAFFSYKPEQHADDAKQSAAPSRRDMRLSDLDRDKKNDYNGNSTLLDSNPNSMP